MTGIEFQSANENLALDGFRLRGFWNASSNEPALANGTGRKGDTYRVSAEGTQNLGSGAITFDAGNLVVYDGSTWFRILSNRTALRIEEEKYGDPEGISRESTTRYPTRKAVGKQLSRLDARDWVGYTETSSDRGPQLNEALKASFEDGRPLQAPAFLVTVSEPAIVESFRGFYGHPGASQIKVGSGSNCAALKSARYGAGGETGGTERCHLVGIDFDGNFAGNPSVTEAVVDLDGLRPIVEKIHIKNGYINLRSQMTRNLSSGSSKLEDGIFADIGLLDSQVYNGYLNGPHDTNVRNVLARTNNGVNLASFGTALVWTNCHAYGNATYAWEGQGVFNNIIGEGAKNGQFKIMADSTKINNAWFFYGGGSDGRIGIVFGDSEHSASSCNIVGVRIDNCTNGALKFVRTGANSLISGLISAAEGNIAAEVSNASPKLNIDGLRVTGGCVNNLATRTKSSQAEVEPPFSPEIELTGTSEVTTLKPTYAGHILTVRATSTSKVKDNGGTLNLAGDFTGPGMLTLRCDGTNFREMARSSI